MIKTNPTEVANLENCGQSDLAENVLQRDYKGMRQLLMGKESSINRFGDKKSGMCKILYMRFSLSPC
jgi:hypothetical protein